jgi:BirA family biotin operon repressor/biotin-[acetyl-CoA-carboxylase] ligase
VLDIAAERAGYRHIVVERVGSTNDDALALARGGDAGKVWIQARVQSTGRGRSGRAWSSPTGNLYATLLLVDPAEPRHAPELGFVAGLALVRAVRRLPGTPAGVAIKWPNDLLHDGAKFAGILVEGTQRPDGCFAAAIGFGVNCRSHPIGLDYPATDLSALVGQDLSADALFRHLSREMGVALELWDRGRNFAAIRDGWLDHALPKGSRLAARTASSIKEGIFDTIDDRGRLVLQTGSGPLIVDAADVFLTQRAIPLRAPHGENND